MPVTLGDDEGSAPLVVIVDTCVLVDLKSMPTYLNRLFPMLMHMTKMLEERRLTYPREVRREMLNGKFPDAPGTWIASCPPVGPWGSPSDEDLAEVLGLDSSLVDAAGEVDFEKADPYVVALACRLVREHPELRIVVASRDGAVVTASRRLGAEVWDAEAFAAHVAADMTA